MLHPPDETKVKGKLNDLKPSSEIKTPGHRSQTRNKKIQIKGPRRKSERMSCNIFWPKLPWPPRLWQLEERLAAAAAAADEMMPSRHHDARAGSLSSDVSNNCQHFTFIEIAHKLQITSVCFMRPQTFPKPKRNGEIRLNCRIRINFKGR